jgi:hypothetical protein
VWSRGPSPKCTRCVRRMLQTLERGETHVRAALECLAAHDRFVWPEHSEVASKGLETDIRGQDPSEVT